MMKLLFLVMLLIALACVSSTERNPDVVKYSIIKNNDIEKIISRVVKQYNQNIRKTPYITKTYFREKAKCQGKYCMLTEGYGYLHSAGYDCMVPVDNFAFLCENIRKSDRKSSWLALLKYRYKQVPEVKHQTDIAPGYNSLLSAFRWFEKNGPLSKKKHDRYLYKLDTTIHQNGNKVLLGVRFNSVEDYTYSGILYIENKSYNIDHVVLDICDFFSKPFWNWVDANATIRYKYYEGQCFFSSMKVYYKKEDIKHWIEINIYSPPMITIEVTDKEYSILFNNDPNPFVIYNESNWTKYNIPLDCDMANIRKDMETEKLLEEQFKSNSGKPYLITTLKFGEDDTDKREKGYKYVQEKIREFSKMWPN